MLSDKQIQEISKAAADLSTGTGKHPTHIVWGILEMFERHREENIKIYNLCMQWLFDNQQSYPFSITKQDMLY